MSPTFLYTLIAILLTLLLWLGWHSYVLKRRVVELTKAVLNTSNQPLPQDMPHLEELSNAIAALQSQFRDRLADANAEGAQLAAVIEQIPDGIIIADEEDKIQFANPAAHTLLENASLLESRVVQALRYHQLIEIWQKSKKTKTVQSDVLEIPFQRGFLQLVVAPDQYAPGGSLLLIQDLTRLRHLETVRRDFISNLSHELRTPLASLRALTETLQDGALDDPPVAQRFLSRIETEVDALTQMAQELLDLSRIESGQIELNLQNTTPQKILQRATERMRMQAERADIHLVLDCPNELPNIQADVARIEQVLVNLIHNGIKFTSMGGTVTLSAESGSRSIRFAVSDSGIGIPANDLPRIFERFYKADPSRRSRGTGLGLSISKHLIEAHGGKLWAESVEGQGSTFYFELPIN
ncbi:MAG: PAS domain-containing protein [Anaerolineae bacterium]|jgi:two-component system, OmpR family, phosphate regulon sensor histidine kinase PhoR|nr:PAS domain-containing protein [Anaerolineae bacterium]MBT7070030.1 PAS domain-containing protein [Anaerolineae bacterium]MBT7325307.1 PAS domain-containing protein [Anaerolineae bacterium]